MDFSKALNALKKGDKIRREAWDPATYVERTDKVRIITPASVAPYSAPVHDMVATDWKVTT